MRYGPLASARGLPVVLTGAVASSLSPEAFEALWGGAVLEVAATGFSGYAEWWDGLMLVGHEFTITARVAAE